MAPCGLCGKSHEEALIEFSLGAQTYRKKASVCEVLGYVVKMSESEGYAGTVILPPDEVKVLRVLDREEIR